MSENHKHNESKKSNDSQMAEMNAFVKESIQILKEAYLSKRLVLFVGAGADIDSGMPPWDEVVKKFCGRLHQEYEDGTDHLRIPQYYFNSRGKKEYVELCREIFRCQDRLLPNEFHKKIADFNVNIIITTNYTDLLEQEMNRRGYIYKSVCQDKDLPYANNEKLIIKMHGDFAHDNFVLKEDDYLKYSSNFRLIETFVKSVIANSVVLFIGYSFRDPDLKQLFSWIKDIVGSDFQQAYMLEGYRDYNKYEFDYFRNLGVNIIYTNKYGGNHKDALFAVMDMIRHESTGQLSALEEAAKYFAPYLNMNYILRRYMEKGLSICNLGIIADKIWALRSQGDNDRETNEILMKICENFNHDDTKLNDAYDILACALKKSGVNQIEIFMQADPQIEYETIDVPHADSKILDLEMEFDHARLRKMAEHYDIFENHEKGYAKQAYLFYLLEDFVKAYQALCRAADIFFEKKQYDQYYLAQFNKLRIGHMIKAADGEEIGQDVIDKIQKDVETIHLESVLSDIPALSYKDTAFLREIDSFQLHYSLFQDIYRIVQNVKEQQNTIGLSMGSLPTFETLRIYIKDYFLYLFHNGIMVDKYLESREVFVLYLKGMLESVSTLDQQGGIQSEKVKSSNIHAAKINKFELFLMIKYMSIKEIRRCFTDNRMDVLPVEEGCIGYMKTVLKNLNADKKNGQCEPLWNSIFLCAYIHPDEELTEIAVDCITNYLKLSVDIKNEAAVYRFLQVSANNQSYQQKKDGKFQMSDYALGRMYDALVRQLLAEKDLAKIKKWSSLLQTVSDIFYNVYEEGCTQDIKGLLCQDKALAAAKIYPNCSEQNKEIIKQYFKDWEGDSWESNELYYYLVMNEIVEQSENFEGKLFPNMEKIKSGSNGKIVNEYEEMLIRLYNLYMANKLVHTKELKDALKNADQKMLNFLGNMDEFDYSEFHIEWLGRFYDKMLKKIAFQETARTNIIRKFAEESARGSIDRNLLHIYFTYFANIGSMNKE